MIPSKICRRITHGLIKIALVFAMLMVLAIKSCMAQSNRPRTRPVYLGFDVSSGAPRYQLNSNIDVLNSLQVNYFGGMAGGVLANPLGKIKGGIGIYYSGDNVPYTFDLLTANLSVNLYLLRIKEVRHHTWEPYIFGGISEMKNKFYGHYLSDPSTKINGSSMKDPYIGSVLCTHLLAGTGVEYQLENGNRDFIHLYAEVSFGRSVHTNATVEALSDSDVPRSLWIKVGMSFGKFK